MCTPIETGSTFHLNSTDRNSNSSNNIISTKIRIESNARHFKWDAHIPLILSSVRCSPLQPMFSPAVVERKVCCHKLQKCRPFSESVKLNHHVGQITFYSVSLILFQLIKCFFRHSQTGRKLRSILVHLMLLCAISLVNAHSSKCPMMNFVSFPFIHCSSLTVLNDKTIVIHAAYTAIGLPKNS